MLRKDFSDEVKAIYRDALGERFPVRCEPTERDHNPSLKFS